MPTRSSSTESKLARLRREVATAPRQRPTRSVKARRARGREFALRALWLIAILTLPFIIFVRAAVYFSAVTGAWRAVAAGAIVAVLTVTAGAAWVSHRVTGRARVVMMGKWVALPLVLAWSLHALFYLASVNAKSEQVRGYYSSLHPVLRVALATAILANRELVVTDMAREAADYERMGLPINDRTLHYRQRDGWVHAVDLRTIGRPELVNRAVQLYFWSMGFRTLRHVGTADHLHVQLAVFR